MPTNSDNQKLFKEAENLFSDIFSRSKEQLAFYLNKNSDLLRSAPSTFISGQKYRKTGTIYIPEHAAISKIISSPDAFIFFQLEEFWRFYDLCSKSIQNSIVQFSLRPLMELCYGHIIYFVLQLPKKQKDLATISWLCSEALLLSNNGERQGRLRVYESLILELSKEEDKRQFKGFVRNNFLLDKIDRTLKRAFPAISARYISKQLEPYLVEIWGKELSSEYLENTYGWLSRYMHGNVLFLKSMSEEQQTKKHIFKVSVILSLVGYHILLFTNEKILERGDNDISDLKVKVSSLLNRLRTNQGFSYFQK